MSIKAVVPEDDVVSLYLGGEPPKAIAALMGCSAMPIIRVLKESGVYRSQSENMAARHQGMTAAQRRDLARAANEARRGSKSSERELVSRAKGKEGTPIGPNEREVGFALTMAGVVFVANLAIGRFNADIGIPTRRIAIELDGGEWHRSGRKAAQDRTFEAFAVSAGWTVVRYLGTALLHPELIAADIKRVSSDPSILGGERVVRRRLKDLRASPNCL